MDDKSLETASRKAVKENSSVGLSRSHTRSPNAALSKPHFPIDNLGLKYLVNRLREKVHIKRLSNSQMGMLTPTTLQRDHTHRFSKLFMANQT